MNQVKNIGSADNPKQPTFTNTNTNTAKRNSSAEINLNPTKKIKLDVTNNTIWNTEGTLLKRTVSDNSKDDHSKSSFNRETFPNFQNQDCEISTERAKIPLNTIRSLSRTISSTPPSTSPLNTENFVVVSEYIEEKDSDKSSKKKTVIETHSAHINSNVNVRKSESSDLGITALNQDANTSEVDLVMLPSAQQEQKFSHPLPSSGGETNTHSGTPTRIVASGTNVMRQGGAVTFTRITTASTISTVLPTNATVLNRMNISPTMKNQQVMVTTKKLGTDVTQTTAKVSIGNTTISVPLLKPLNSTQLMHPSSTAHGELQKQSQATTATTSQPLSTQTQINLSKILNAKRGQKGSQPTIVSLSQLQIKPVSTTKLVQTKVFSKKLPQVQCSVSTNTNAPTSSGLVSIALSKAKQSISLSQSNSRKSNINPTKQDSIGIIHHNIVPEEGSTNISDRNVSLENAELNERGEKLANNECNAQDSNISLNEMALSKNTTATIKKVLNPNVNILPLLTPLSKSSDQQSNTGIYPAVSIIRQNAPQLISTSATTTCVSVSTSASDANIHTTNFHSGKSSTNPNNISGKINSSLIAIPKNISLVLSKNSLNQQAKATIVSTSAVRSSNTIDQKIKKINLTVSSALNVSAVNSLNMSQAFNVGSSSSSTSIQSHSQPDASQVTNKSTIISVAVQAPSYINSSEQNVSRKTLKVTPYTLSTLGQHLDKRCKPQLEGHEQDNRQNAKSNIDILPAKRSKNDNSDGGGSAEPLDAMDKKKDIGEKTNATTTGDVKSVINIDKHTSVEVNQSSIIVNKSEESNNVLLKKLLQNSSNTHSVNILTTNPMTTTSTTTATSMCNQVLAARKVINVRAPSLGLVSSLEAQLARPVIPPVPATATASQIQTDLSKMKKIDVQNELTNKINTEIQIGMQNEAKIKTVQVISKETSFVSNPNMSPFTLDDNTRSSRITATSNQNLETDSIQRNNTVNVNLCDLNRLHSSSPKGSNSNCFKEFGNTQDKQFQCDEINENIHTEQKTEQKSSSELCSAFSSSAERKEDVKVESFANFTSSNATALSTKDNSESFEKQTLVNKFTKDAKGNALEGTVKSGTLSQSERGGQNINVPSSVNSNLNTDNAHLNEKSQQSYECNVAISNIATSNQKTIITDKDVESRKKRKREYQKHRRQLLSNSKELAANSAVGSTSNVPGSKKKSRKLSKIEEDYDNFIDNLMTHLKQMKPLQVLEPLLNRNFVICSTYGLSNNLPRGVNSKDNCDIFLTAPLSGEYGNAHRANVITMYDSGSLLSAENSKEKQLSTIQNDFYDQEFSSNMRNNQNERFLRIWGIMRDRNIEASDMITNTSDSSVDSLCSLNTDKFKRLSFHQFVYPGLVVMNKNCDYYLDQMSPSIPMIDPTFNAKKITFEKAFNKIDDIENVKQTFTCGTDTNRTRYDDSNNRVVTLSLQLSSVNNIFSVLKDLANLLHISAPSMYKIIDAPAFHLSKDHLSHNNNINKPSVRGPSFQHDVICGRKKICYNCGTAITEDCIQAFKTPFCDIKGMPDSNLSSNLSPMKLEFCNSYCYQQFKSPSKLQYTSATSSNVDDMQLNAEREFKENIANEKETKLTLCNQQGSTINKKLETKSCIYKHYNANWSKELKANTRLSCENYTHAQFSEDKCQQQKGFTGCILNSSVEDMRQCVFCFQRGDGAANGPSRLLNFDIDKWVHLNCALWSSEVYETISGGLMNFAAALQVGLNQSCSGCQQLGATVRCFKTRCMQAFHLPCAIRENCVFYKNKTILCQQHANRLEKENELSSLVVQRRVFVERDENRQVATVMHHSELTNLLRVGTLIFLNVGQLLPHQLEAFHNMDHIYPVGYKVIRFYWSMKRPNHRCRYVCSIAEVGGRPEFRIQVQEPGIDVEVRDSTPNAVWKQILNSIASMRKHSKVIKLFPEFISGEDLFGLTEPSVVRIIESLPGIETLTNYRFKYGRNPLLELPLAINPSGSARTEPKQRQIIAWRKPHTQRTATTANQRMVNPATSTIAGEIACPYSKQFVHSKSSQYKKMKQEWRNNVYLARSKIQGLGLYAARDIEKHTMIIEYIGEVIRTEVSEIREKQYEAKNRGIYMFRLDEDRVVDATLSGGLARYINHACNPNCVTEIVDVDRELRIIIFAKRRINRGEELSYDYKFDIEDESHKISCMCGSPNCRKWMN